MTTINGSQERATQKTIEDFGAQWTDYTKNEGYYASTDMFADISCNLIATTWIQGKDVADIGSGTGRIVAMLLDSGAASVKAIEPSKAMDVLKKNLATRLGNVECLQERGEAVGKFKNLDLVTSIGVLHHIPEPSPVVSSAYKALKAEGKILIWLYAKEGNSLYLFFTKPLRAVTKRMPDFLLKMLCGFLAGLLNIYIALCRVLPLPMRDYMLGVLSKLSILQRYLTIYDQLNPHYAKYYTREEAIQLLEGAGFRDIEIAHRHGYSWTVVGTKV